jgi:ketosteroid isomerase-like protein
MAETAVRTPIRSPGTQSARRPLEGRLAARVPRLSSAVMAAVLRLPPRSRLRRSLLARAVRRGYEAANRGDFELLFLFYDPNVEFRFTAARGFVPPDLVGTLHGPESLREIWGNWREMSDDFRLVPEEVLDLGDRSLISVRAEGLGRGSGVPFGDQVAEVFTYRGGKVVRQEIFRERAEALAAAGIAEDAY